MPAMNKSIIIVTSFLSLICQSYMAGDDNCNGYYPTKAGTVYEISSYNGNDKLTGVAKYGISDAVTAGDTLILSVSGAWNDNNGKPLHTSSFKVKCLHSTVFMNMSNMGLLDPKQTFPGKGSVTMQGDYLNIPSNPHPDEVLKSGTLTIILDHTRKKDTIPWLITSTISNRRVEKMEKITTPAGTFNCVKITYDVSTFTIFVVKSHVAEWYALNTGIVRSERYSEDGQIQGYSVLTSISGN